MMIIRIMSPLCAPLESINEAIAPRLKGNDLRAILNRHIDNDLILHVSVFESRSASAFRREFIEPTLNDKGYPIPGKYKVKSKLLYGRDVEYLVDVVPYSKRLADKHPSIKWDGAKTVDGFFGRIIDSLKYGEQGHGWRLISELSFNERAKITESIFEDLDKMVYAIREAAPTLLAKQIVRNNEILTRMFDIRNG